MVKPIAYTAYALRELRRNVTVIVTIRPTPFTLRLLGVCVCVSGCDMCALVLYMHFFSALAEKMLAATITFSV